MKEPAAGRGRFGRCADDRVAIGARAGYFVSGAGVFSAPVLSVFSPFFAAAFFFFAVFFVVFFGAPVSSFGAAAVSPPEGAAPEGSAANVGTVAPRNARATSAVRSFFMVCLQHPSGRHARSAHLDANPTNVPERRPRNSGRLRRGRPDRAWRTAPCRLDPPWRAAALARTAS